MTAASYPLGRADGAETSTWVRMGDATALLGVSPATVRRWADEGHLVSWTTPGGHRRFERSSLLAFVALERSGTSEEAGNSAPAARPGEDAPSACHRVAGQRGLWLEVRRLTVALVGVLQAAEAGRHELERTAEDAAARFGFGAASRGMSAEEMVATFVMIRNPLLRAVSASASLRGLDGPATSELLVSAITTLDRLLDRSLAAHLAFRPAS
jgi:excisionase family DNA binding protein